MTTYQVIVTREGDAWLADVPGVSGTHTWAKNLPGLDRNVREAIALAEDLPDGAEAGLDLAYQYDTGDPDLDAEIAALRAERARLAQAEQELSERTARLAEQIVRQRGMSVRDAATLLHISPQRVSQVAPHPHQPSTCKLRADATLSFQPFSRTTPSRRHRHASRQDELRRPRRPCTRHVSILGHRTPVRDNGRCIDRSRISRPCPPRHRR